MTPQRPYLLRAIHQWIVDNDCTPYVVVDASRPDVNVPAEHVTDGQIVLNLSYGATDALSLGNSEVQCACRFGGVARPVSFPVQAVIAIYAKENGQGLAFPSEEVPEDPDGGPDDTTPSGDGAPGPARRGPSLKVVK